MLRYVRALGDNAVVVLGNHDLHLLALAHDRHRKRRSSDTLDAIFGASDRDALLDWLLRSRLRILTPHAVISWCMPGVIPQWTATAVIELAG